MNEEMSNDPLNTEPLDPDQLYAILQLPKSVDSHILERTIIKRIEDSSTPEQAAFYWRVYETFFEQPEDEPLDELPNTNPTYEEEKNSDEEGAYMSEDENEYIPHEHPEQEIDKTELNSQVSQNAYKTYLQKQIYPQFVNQHAKKADTSDLLQNPPDSSNPLTPSVKDPSNTHAEDPQTEDEQQKHKARHILYKPKSGDFVKNFYANRTPLTPIVLRANNPILKETVTQQLCIYSNSRVTNDRAATPTHFTVQLTDPLRDVLKMSMYGFSIPNTWYTISSIYGANFILLKGVAPGLYSGFSGQSNGQSNTGQSGFGDYDYKIEISPGNYTSKQLVAAVQTAFSALFESDPRVSFIGSTHDISASATDPEISSRFEYNETTYRSTFALNLTRRYKDVDYKCEFDNWTNTSASLPGYMGFRDKTYSLSQHRSQYNVPLLTNPDSTQYSLYTIDASNRSIQLIVYDDTVSPEIMGDAATNIADISGVLNVLPITLSLETGIYSRARIADACTIALQSNSALLPTSLLGSHTSHDITTSEEMVVMTISGSPYCYLQVDWQPSYYQRPYASPHVKTAIQFPDESHLNATNGKRPVWTNVVDSSGTALSCFRFNPIQYAQSGVSQAPLIYEIGSILADTPLNNNTITISGSGAFFGFHCSYLDTDANSAANNKKWFWTGDTDFSGNDCRIQIPGGTYSYPSFIETVQEKILASNASTTNPFQFVLTNSRMELNATNDGLVFQIDANRAFPPSQFSVDLSGSFIGAFFPDISTAQVLPFQQNASFRSIVGIGAQSTYLCKIKIPPTADVSGVMSEWTIPKINANSALAPYAMADAITRDFQAFVHPGYDSSARPELLVYPLRESAVTYDKLTNAWNFQITVQLAYTENNYDIILSEELLPMFDISSALTDISVNINGTDINKIFKQSPIKTYSVLSEPYARIQSTVFSRDNPYIPQLFTPVDSESGGNGGNGSSTDGIKWTYDKSELSMLQVQRIRADISGVGQPLYRGDLIQRLNNSFKTYQGVPITYIDSLGGTQTSYVQDEHWDLPGLQIDPVRIQTIGGNDYIQLRPNLQYTFTAADYELVAYDSNSYSGANVTNSTNNGGDVTPDFTLGWMLGFRTNVVYPLYSYITDTTATNPNEIICQIIGDTTVLSNVYNNLYIVLDDFTNARLGDGLLITHPYDNVDQQPNAQNQRVDQTAQYANTTAMSIYSTLALQNSVRATQSNRVPTYSQDAFAILPVKRSADGQNYVDTGGTLGLQNRNYIGPVNISKLGIRLVDERGFDVDLNGGEWSFIVTVEKLYRRDNPDLTK